MRDDVLSLTDDAVQFPVFAAPVPRLRRAQ
jgi:hypothetical protein